MASHAKGYWERDGTAGSSHWLSAVAFFWILGRSEDRVLELLPKVMDLCDETRMDVRWIWMSLFVLHLPMLKSSGYEHYD